VRGWLVVPTHLFKLRIMTDWKEGVDYTCADTLNAKDKWEAFLLKIQEAKISMPIQIVELVDLENKVIAYIEYLKEQFILRSAGENVG
jgi:hypothetical protein